MLKFFQNIFRIIVFVVILIDLAAIMLLFAADSLSECYETQGNLSVLCEHWNNLRTVVLVNQIPIKQNIVSSIIYSGIGLIVSWIANKLFPTNAIRDARFPFDYMYANQLLETISSFPSIEVSYIKRENDEMASALSTLKEERNVLLVGKPGSGKTREVIELVNRMDSPPGSVLVVRPNLKQIEDSFQWPTNIQFQQHRVVLLLDDLQDYEAEGDDRKHYLLHDSPTEFETVLSRVLNNFEEHCYDFRVIATIRSDSTTWKTLSKRPNNTIWRKFRMLELPNHTWSEAVQYCTVIESKLTRIRLSFSAETALADKFDGTFASIRDYLRLKDAEMPSDITPFSLLKENVSDFSGLYPADWEHRYYEPFVKVHRPAEAIFKALSVASKTHIVPYEKVIIRLSSKMLSGSPQWWRERQCRNALKQVSTWISNRKGLLEAPAAYIEGKADFTCYIDEITDTLLFYSRDPQIKRYIIPSLLNLAQISTNILNNNNLALKLAHRALEIEPKNPKALHSVGITYDKMGNHKKSIEYCRKALDYGPDYFPAYATLGVSLSKSHMYKEALEILQKGYRLFPTKVSILVPLAIVLDRQNERDEAIAKLLTAIQVEPENISALVTIAITYQRLGSPNIGSQYLEKALILDPDNLSLYQIASRFVPDLDENTRYKILTTMSQISLNKGDYSIHCELCKLFRLLGHEEIAQAHLKKLFSLQLELAEEFWAVGEVLYDFEEYQKAINYFKRALKKDKNYYKALTSLGRVYSILGDVEKAIIYFRQSVKLNPESAFARAGLGNALMQCGLLSEASDHLIRAIELEPDNPFAWTVFVKLLRFRAGPKAINIEQLAKRGKSAYAWISLAITQQQTGLNTEFEESLNRARVLVGNNPFFWINLANILKEIKLHDEVEIAYKEVIRLNPNNILAYSFLSSAYIQLDRLEEASQALDKAIKLSQGDPPLSVLNTQGLLLMRLDKLDQAFSSFGNAIALNPKHAYAWSGIAQVLTKQGKFGEAFINFQKAIDLGQQDAVTWSGLGMVAKKLGRLDIAEEAFRSSIAIESNHPLPWSHLGEVLQAQGKLEDAVSAFNKAVKLNEANDLAWSGLGHVYNQLGQFEQAIEPHRKALAFGNDSFTTYYGLGKALLRCNLIDEAAVAFIESLKRNPRGPAKGALIGIYSNLADDPEKQGLVKMINDIFSSLNLSIDVINIISLTNQALEKAENGIRDAIEICDFVVSLKPADPEIMCKISSAYRHLDQRESAITSATEATKLNPNFHPGWYTLGRAYEEAGNLVEAKKAYKKALELKPNYEKAQQAIERLETSEKQENKQ